MGGLGGAGRVDRAVVGDDADREAVDARVPAHGRRTIERGEFDEVRVVGDAGDHFLHVDRPPVIHRHDSEQFLGVVARWPARTPHLRRYAVVPVELAQEIADDAQRVAVILGQIVAEPGNGRVHFGAAEFLLGRDLTGRRHEQRRAGEKGPRTATHHDDVIGQAGLVGASRRR